MFDNKPDAEVTALLTIQLFDGHMTTIILPTPQFIHYFEDCEDKLSEMCFPLEIEENDIVKEGDEVAGVYFDITNDPTPQRAGGVVSLGYYCLRFVYKYCKIKSFKPFTLVGYGGDAEYAIIEGSFTRPLRRITP